MPAAKAPRKTRRRNGIAAVLRLFTPKTVKPRKGNKAYKRRAKHPSASE